MSKDIVVYEGMAVHISHAERDDGVRILEGMEDTVRRKVLASVSTTLDMFVTKVRQGHKPTALEADSFCKDVGIWFCERVRTGEADKSRVGSVQ